MVNSNNLNCEQVWREISNYLDGEVDQPLRDAMDVHFKTCTRCASVLAGMRNVVSLYGDERMIEVPAGYGRRLEKRLARSARSSSRGWSTLSAWLVPVAALALIAGGLRLANSLTISPPLKTEHAQPAHDIPAEMMVVVTADAKVFHAPGCDYIHNKASAKTMTAKEAMSEGYVPCLRCMRKYLDTAQTGHSTLGVEADADEDVVDDPHSRKSR
jgi:hypothetical protein